MTKTEDYQIYDSVIRHDLNILINHIPDSLFLLDTDLVTVVSVT